MNFRPLLMMTLGLLSTAALYAESNRLEACAKFNVSYALFSSLESTDNNNDGWSFDQTSGLGFETGTVLGFSNGLRWELGILVHPSIKYDGVQVANGNDTPNSEAKLHVDAYSVLTDLNWDFTHGFMPESPFQGFIGLGLGVSYLDTDEMKDRLGAYEKIVAGDRGWNPSYRLSLGFQYQLSAEFIFTCSYSYMYLGELELTTKWTDNTGASGNDFPANLDLDLEAQVLQIGLNYVF